MSDLLQRLSRELGRDAVEEANARHPELRTAPDAMVARLVNGIEYVLQSRQWPVTIENCERAYSALKANGDFDEIASQYASAPSTPRTFETSDAEENYLRHAPLEDVRQYLEQKYAK